MAEKQGAAAVYVRAGRVLVWASSVIEGWLDERGVRRGMLMDDWEAFEGLLSLDDTDDILGGSLRRALEASRIQIPAKVRDNRLTAAGDFDEVLAKALLLDANGDVFSGLRNVAVSWELGDVRMGPTRNDGHHGFEGFPRHANRGHEEIVVAFVSTDGKLGAALREAIARCL